MTDAVPHTSGLLDTSTLILLNQLTDSEDLAAEPVISTITLAELSVGSLIAASPGERSARQAHLQQAEADFDPFPFDTGRRPGLRRSGRFLEADRTQNCCSCL